MWQALIPLATSLASSYAPSLFGMGGGGGGFASMLGLLPGETGGMPDRSRMGLPGLSGGAAGILGNMMGSNEPRPQPYAPSGGMGRGSQINIADPMAQLLQSLVMSRAQEAKQGPSLAALLAGRQ